MTVLAYRVRDLTKVYKNSVVANDGISLDTHVGETFGLLGPNGAGKTTLVRQMVGLLRPTKGRIELFGRDIVRDPDEVPRHVAYLPQTLMSLSAYRVREAVYYTGLLRGLPGEEAAEQTSDLLERLSLTSLSGRLVRTLSAGQKQLVALASTLVGYRPLLILDEPTSNLDPVVRRLVGDLLEELREKRGLTIVLVTHSVLEAERVLSRVAIIDRGRVIALGTPSELKERVASRVRVEFRPKHDLPCELAQQPDCDRLPDGCWRLAIPRASLPEVVERLAREVGLENMDDLRILPPSLEDVYLALNGSRPRIAETAATQV